MGGCYAAFILGLQANDSNDMGNAERNRKWREVIGNISIQKIIKHIEYAYMI